MNVETGELTTLAEVMKLSKDEQKKYIPVVRNTTLAEQVAKEISLYSPCACGSGKKFKFCCHKKP